MAATRLIALHVNKGKSVAQCLRARTDYVQNPEKTDNGELVTAYECDPMIADQEFLLSKRQYEHITGRRQKRDVIAYQIRQSFKPGEVTPKKQTPLARSWPNDLPRANTLLLWLPIQIGRISTITSYSTQLPWIVPGSFGIFICPGWFCLSSVT